MVTPTLNLTTLLGRDTDVVELLALCVKLKNLGKEYIRLCHFQGDHSYSLIVNQGNDLWICHSTFCGTSGSLSNS